MPSPIPWPKKGMKAFVPGSEEEKFFHKGSLPWHYSQHADAFRTAADVIIDARLAAETGPHHDELLYPVLFLYRHSLEIRLKDLIWEGIHAGFFQKAEVQDVLDGHSLASLWKHAKRLVQDCGKGCDQSPVEGVESIINEFHQVDSNGQKLRYEREKDTLKKHRHEKLPDRIDPANLRHQMSAVHSLLFGCECMVRDALDNCDFQT